MRSVALTTLIAALSLTVAPAGAQTNPADMRSGCLSFTNVIGVTTQPAFVVPSSNRFVLTDINFNQVPATGPFTVGTHTVRLGVNTAGTTPVNRWIVTATANPQETHWGAGIVFEPNQVVEIAVQVLAGPMPEGTVCWSGYLVPTTTTSVIPRPSTDDLVLEAAPNPSLESTTLRFTLDRKQHVTVGVYGVDGRRVRIQQRGVLEAGEHRLAWDGRDGAGRPVASGLYFAELETGRGQTARRIARTR